MNASTSSPFRVLIVGGGVAGLEAALALRELAGGLVATTLLAPADDFVYRPMRVREPFGYNEARRYPLDDICRDIGVELVRDAFELLEPEGRVVHTRAGETLEYDALLLAPGATLRPGFTHALTLDDSRLDEQLHGLIQDVEGGYVHKLAFISPTPMPWPLPLYELALMTARRAYDMNVDLSITLATPEDAPLAVFGSNASVAVEKLLVDNGILFIGSAHCETPAQGRVSITPGSRNLMVDRIIALPQLFGPALPGVPLHAHDGFVPIDRYCKVVGIERVYAAGDATDFPVKFGGIASQQADTAAAAIAALAGAAIEPTPFTPELHGALLGGPKPLYLSAHITGGHGTSSEASEALTSAPPAKIVAKHLAPYLESRDQAALR
jgi:sulfide:quinone oxidoreductase